MRLLCVGRHRYLSEHLCRVFGELGAECVPVVGAANAPASAARVEPHVVVCDCDLITPAMLDEWAAEPMLVDLPVIAVSLTKRPEEAPRLDRVGVSGVVYLPMLDRGQLAILLVGAPRTRGVTAPAHWWSQSLPQPLSA